DGKRVFCASTAGGRDRATLAEIDVETGKLNYLEPNLEHEVEGVTASPGGAWLAYLVNNDGRSELRLRDLKTGKTSPVGRLPLGVVSGLESSRDDGNLALAFDGPRHNMDVWVVDLKTLAARQLTHSSRAGVPFSELVEPELIHYPTFDDRKIPAWFYKPARQ